MKSKKAKIEMPKTFSDQPKGLVICYLGAGKGKTTAAMGMAVRASGAGMNVFILQFVKAKAGSSDSVKDGEWPVSCEIDFFNFFNKLHHPNPHPPRPAIGGTGHLLPEGEGGIGLISNEQLGLGFVGILGDKKDKEIHIRQAIYGLERAREIIASGKYQLIILDEIISALELKLIEERDVLDLLAIKPEHMHVVLTGHNKYPKILKQCDLVTEMKMLKHPYYKGILAQRGIDY
jgi:cob(I)alamin adenosyltransferase